MDIQYLANKHRDAFISAQDRFKGDSLGLAHHIYHNLKNNWNKDNIYLEMLSELGDGTIDKDSLLSLAELILKTKPE